MPAADPFGDFTTWGGAAAPVQQTWAPSAPSSALEQRWPEWLQASRREAAAAQLAGHSSPIEVIHSVFLRGKRPIVAPLSSRWLSLPVDYAAPPASEADAEMDDALNIASTSSMPAPRVRGVAGDHVVRSARRALTPDNSFQEEFGVPAAKRPRLSANGSSTPGPKAAAATASAVRRGDPDMPRVWRSVLRLREPHGVAGTIGDWLRARGEL